MALNRARLPNLMFLSSSYSDNLVNKEGGRGSSLLEYVSRNA